MDQLIDERCLGTRSVRNWSWTDERGLVWIVEAVSDGAGWWRGAVQVLANGITVAHATTSIKGSADRLRARLERRVLLVRPKAESAEQERFAG